MYASISMHSLSRMKPDRYWLGRAMVRMVLMFWLMTIKTVFLRLCYPNAELLEKI